MFEVTEWHKLYDVTQHWFPFRRTKDSVIPVQHLHVSEICASNSHDYDRHGQVRGVDDRLSSVRHIRDHPVRQDEQDEVLLHRGKKGPLEQEEL